MQKSKKRNVVSDETQFNNCNSVICVNYFIKEIGFFSVL